jgi:uncharacterized membrane protein YfcA
VIVDAALASSVALGALVGAIMGLTGAGGGMLAVPILVFGLQRSVAEAAPIALLAVGAAAAAGTLIGLKAGIVRYRAAALVAGTGIAMVPVGLWLARHADTRIPSLLFGLVLMWVAHITIRHARRPVLRSPGLVPSCARDADSGRFVWTGRCAAMLSLSGGIAGLASGLLGVGGGFVMVPALQRQTDLPLPSVVATSLAVVAMISLGGVVASVALGRFDWAVGLPFAAGTMLGMVAASAVSSRVPGRYLALAFAGLCAIVAAGMIVQSFR